MPDTHRFTDPTGARTARFSRHRREGISYPLTDTAFLTVGRRASSGTCRIAVDLITTDSGFAPIETACQKILATTSLAARNALYFIVMTESRAHTSEGRIVVAERSSVREETVLEQKLASEFANGKILAVKDAVRKVLGER